MMHNLKKEEYAGRWFSHALLAVAVTSVACTPPDPKADQEPQTATTRLNINSRGVTSLAAGAGSRASASYRAHMVVGPEMPVAQGTSANYRVLLGPIIPATGDIDEQVQVFGQPEHATYRFETNSPADWTLTLYVGACNASSRSIVYSTTASGQSVVNGTWAGLAPGTAYCWVVNILGFSGPMTKMGDFTTPGGASVSAFGFAQAAASDPFDMMVTTTLSGGAASAPTVHWEAVANAGSDLNCDDFEPSLKFAAGQMAVIPGDILPTSDFTIETWIRMPDRDWNAASFPILTARSSSPDNSGGSGYDAPGLRFAWKNGGPEACLWTDQTNNCIGRAPSNITNRQWVQMTYRYSGAQHAVFINGIRLNSSNRRGDIRGNHDICLGGCGSTQNGVFTSGATFEIGKVVIYDDALTTSQISSSYDSGRGRWSEDYRVSDQLALFNFNEGPRVQNFYDVRGKWAGHLGSAQTSAADDPSRLPVFASNVSAFAGTSAASWGRPLKCVSGCIPSGPDAQLTPTELTVGPTYCARVDGRVGAFDVAARPIRATRRIDNSAPTVTADPPTIVAECDRPGEARVDLTNFGNGANTSDDYDSAPVLEARLGSQSGTVITFPRNFPMGSTSVYWSSTDDWLNKGWTNPAQTIRVRDRTGPSATPGPALVVEAVSPNGTAYTPALQSVSDICDSSPTTTYTPQGPYALGDTVVAFTVVDDSLNSATANRTVRVVDTTPPVFDPPLTTILLGHPGSSVPCLEFTPPTPTVRDNGYDAGSITVSGGHVSGPGAPNCYDVGTHVYRWTATDPSNNTVTVDQTISVQTGSIDVRYLGLEVSGIQNPVAGRFYNSAVTVKFELSGGNGQYDVVVTPTPVSLSNVGAVYSAQYTADGSYPQILVQVRDQNGTGPNVGSAAYDGFGIDTAVPTFLTSAAEAMGIPQQGIDPTDPSTSPFLVKGQKLEFNRIAVSDGTADKANLGGGVRQETGGAVQCISVPAPNQAAIPSPACVDGKVPVGVVGAANRDLFTGYSIEMWVKPEVLGHYTLLAVPNRSSDAGGSAMELYTTPTGRVCFGGYVNDARNSSTCSSASANRRTVVGTGSGALTARQWHHVVATWEWSTGTTRIYVDGHPTAFRVNTGLFTTGAGLKLCDAVMGGGGVTAMILGAHLNEDGQTASNEFVGDIGQFRFSMKPLTHAEVLANYNGGAGRTLLASNTAFIDFELEGAAGAQFGLQSVVDSNTGLCASNESCAWSSPVSAFLGSTIGTDGGDPTRVSHDDPADGTASGISLLQISLINRDGGAETLLTRTTSVAHGSPIKAAMRTVDGHKCSQSSSACTVGDSLVDIAAIANSSARGYGSRFILRTTATDAAGNQATDDIYFNILDYPGALQKGIDALAVLIPQNSVTELEDARLWMQVAKSYYELTLRYEDGSYLRAGGALQYLVDAENNGVDTGTISSYVARALYGDVKYYHDTLGAGSFLPGDEEIWSNADRRIVAAQFYGSQGMDDPDLRVFRARAAYDGLAMLYPRFRAMRERINSARGVWERGLSDFSNGSVNVSNLRTDIGRQIQLRGGMAETRDALRESLYLQIAGVLSNPFTSQRQALEEMLDVLDKSNSNDADEQGDLIAITDLSVQDACLDRLARLTLDDQTFTRCYLRLNDLAQFLDGVSEPLVHTYRMRTGLGLGLFHMLEASLFLSPTGIPWVTSNQNFTVVGTEELILPDALANTINGATPISTVDLSDGTLARAYQKYDEAKGKLDEGDIDGAWRIFVDERCLLLRTYNRYYSTDRTITNPADPKEAPIDPATVGCQ